LLQSVHKDGNRAMSGYTTGPTMVPPNSGIVISNATPRFEDRLHIARRIFGLIPVIVFLLALSVFMSVAPPSFYGFSNALLRVIAVSLASSIVCIAAYGFYRYLLDRSPGL
jgi:hypothetical protein